MLKIIVPILTGFIVLYQSTLCAMDATMFRQFNVEQETYNQHRVQGYNLQPHYWERECGNAYHSCVEFQGRDQYFIRNFKEPSILQEHR